MYLKKSIVFFYFLAFSTVFAQYKSSKGDGYFFSYVYQDAIAAYESDLEKGYDLSPRQYLNLADSYLKVGRFKNASDIYLRLFEQDSLVKGKHLNMLLKSLGNSSGNGRTMAFLNDKVSNLSQELKENAEFNMDLINSEEVSNDLEFQVFSLDCNSPYSDFSPSFFKGNLLFSSGRPIEKRQNYEPMGEAYLDIFEGEIGRDGQVSNANKSSSLRDSDYHKATPYFSEELNSLFYVLSNTTDGQLEFDETGKNALGIGMQKMDGGFRFLWRDLSTSFYYPFYDHQTSRLYFAADLKGGYGGTDLYYVNTSGGQIMSAPINLGPRVNTLGNEIAPFIFEGVLYFSSDVFYGLGGMDVYRVNVKNGGFTNPINLGKPVNSEYDDFGFIIRDKEEGLLGYFSSNRIEGKGKDDLYGFLVNKKPGIKTFAVNGKVVSLKNTEGIPEATIRVYGPNGEVLQETLSNALGDYFIEVPWQSRIRLEATKERHSIFSLILGGEQMETTQKSNLNIGIAKYDDLVEDKEGQKVVKLKDFYFPKGKSTVVAEIATELDKVVDFVQRFPTVQLRIETHTDSRGGSSTNFRITQARSDAIKKYLLQKGVPASNILYSIGYGEEKIINNCQNGVYCIEMLHKKNQRSLIVVLNDNVLFD